jgi:hypothetical protein
VSDGEYGGGGAVCDVVRREEEKALFAVDDIVMKEEMSVIISSSDEVGAKSAKVFICGGLARIQLLWVDNIFSVGFMVHLIHVAAPF